MVKRWLFLAGSIIGILILPSLARPEEPAETQMAKADDFTLSGYIEVGKRSTAEDYEEEGADDDYTYRNYHLKFGQEVSHRLTPLETSKHLNNKARSLTGLSYDISSFIYKKDYKSRESLDNISRLFKTNWSYYLRRLKEEHLKLDFRLNYKEKRYKNTPGSEYDQIRLAPTLTFKKKDLYTVDLTAGIDNYDYLAPGAKDQLKIFSKIEGDRYFIDKKLMLTGSYKLENTEQEEIDRKRTKQEVMGGFDYLNGVYKIITRAGWGERDTKEEEERDEDFDYEYWRYYTKTEHRINPKLKTDLKYQYFKKDYISADLDHRGFYIQNGWDYEVLDDEKQRWGLEFNIEHKDVDYALKTGNNYKKETAELKAIYQRKKNYKTLVSWSENFYDFNDSSNDKKRYYAKLGLEKLFFKGDVVLLADFKYRYTDYEQKDDSRTEAVRLAFKYKF